MNTSVNNRFKHRRYRRETDEEYNNENLDENSTQFLQKWQTPSPTIPHHPHHPPPSPTSSPHHKPHYHANDDEDGEFFGAVGVTAFVVVPGRHNKQCRYADNNKAEE